MNKRRRRRRRLRPPTNSYDNRYIYLFLYQKTTIKTGRFSRRSFQTRPTYNLLLLIMQRRTQCIMIGGQCLKVKVSTDESNPHTYVYTTFGSISLYSVATCMIAITYHCQVMQFRPYCNHSRIRSTLFLIDIVSFSLHLEIYNCNLK